MTSTRTWTAEECIEEIEALEAKRVALVDVPVKGTVGRTTVDLSTTPKLIDDALRLWRARLATTRSATGLAERPRWGC